MIAATFKFIGALGDKPTDSAEVREQHRFLIYMGIFMSGGGILWGSLASYYGLYLAASIPYGYTIATGLNFWWFHRTKHFACVRAYQVGMSLLLPFMFQIFLGGFVSSGAVMLWSMLAIVGSLTFLHIRTSLGWLALYLLGIIITGSLDSYARTHFATEKSHDIEVLFFVVNMLTISTIVLGLVIYLIANLRQVQENLITAYDATRELKEHLERQVIERTRELEVQFQESEAAFANLSEGLVIVPNDNGPMRANQALFSILGLPITSDMHLDPNNIPNELLATSRDSIEENRVICAEIFLDDGRLIEAVASPIQSTRPGALEMRDSVVVCRDVSAERQVEVMEEQLAISERMASLGTLAAGIAHEVNNPLTYALGNVDFLLADIKSIKDGKLVDFNEMMQSATDAIDGIQRVAHIVSELGQFSRPNPSETTQTKLESVIETALSLANHQIRHKATVKKKFLEDGLVEVQSAHLVQVMVNLFVNAAHAMKHSDIAKNRITVTTKRITDDQAVITVADNGTGMSPETQRRIFDPFFTTKTAQGTGLGLAISQRIIHEMNGTLTVSSTLGTGSIFTIKLPLASHPSEEHTGTHVLPKSKPAARKLLIVDDNVSVGRLLVRFLSGHDVSFVTSVKEAMAHIQMHPPELIICDMMMPGENGISLYKQMAKQGQEHTIVFCTGGISDEEAMAFLAIHQVPLLHKPITKPQLLEFVDRFFQNLESNE